ncbi:hypothetical protein FGG78_25655 [Thioclava sp. BHET1]|nr:hypothetical protein FGG78_25655 [Thioclava sp. BHET1]
MRLKTLILCTTLLGAAAPLTGLAAESDQPFAPAAIVNGSAVTNYEVDQRAKMLTVLSGPGDHTKQALKALIDERVELAQAKQFGVTVSDDDIKQGEAEFASRAKLSTEQFLDVLAKAGVAPETFRDFVRAGQAWRQVVRGLISPTVTVSDADVISAQSATMARGAPEVLLSELVLPATPEYIAQTEPLAKQLSQTLHGDAAFSAAARKYSASQSAPNGGQLKWMPASNLPSGIAQEVLALSPGQVSAPITVPNAFVLFEMRGLRDAQSIPRDNIEDDYMIYTVGDASAESRARAAHLQATLTDCAQLYKLNKGKPASLLQHETQKLPQVPADVALELAKLNPGASSISLQRPGQTALLMLCSRNVVTDPPTKTSDVRDAVFNKRVEDKAEAYLAKLRAGAVITYP